MCLLQDVVCCKMTDQTADVADVACKAIDCNADIADVNVG